VRPSFLPSSILLVSAACAEHKDLVVVGRGAGYGTLLFSLWDAKNPDAENCASGKFGPNTTWCTHKHSFPLSANCHRHCLDCGLHPGWHNTSGTQCSIDLPQGIADVRLAQ
jgi:hypothetical protein